MIYEKGILPKLCTFIIIKHIISNYMHIIVPFNMNLLKTYYSNINAKLIEVIIINCIKLSRHELCN